MLARMINTFVKYPAESTAAKTTPAASRFPRPPEKAVGHSGISASAINAIIASTHRLKPVYKLLNDLTMRSSSFKSCA